VQWTGKYHQLGVLTAICRETEVADLWGQLGVPWWTAGQRRRKIRSVAPLCPACRATLAAGHHGCALTCQAPICRACSSHTAA